MPNGHSDPWHAPPWSRDPPSPLHTSDSEGTWDCKCAWHEMQPQLAVQRTAYILLTRQKARVPDLFTGGGVAGAEVTDIILAFLDPG